MSAIDVRQVNEAFCCLLLAAVELGFKIKIWKKTSVVRDSSSDSSETVLTYRASYRHTQYTYQCV